MEQIRRAGRSEGGLECHRVVSEGMGLNSGFVWGRERGRFRG